MEEGGISSETSLNLPQHDWLVKRLAGVAEDNARTAFNPRKVSNGSLSSLSFLEVDGASVDAALAILSMLNETSCPPFATLDRFSARGLFFAVLTRANAPDRLLRGEPVLTNAKLESVDGFLEDEAVDRCDDPDAPLDDPESSSV